MNYHMKRLAYLPILLTSFLLGSCTLVMDNYDTEEGEENVNLEEVGFDEPYTQKGEFGSVTFQYADSTRVLRAEAMNYLVRVEDDSILYFTDNIPQDLLIPEGLYVSMGCNEHLRHGLCSQVVSLTQQNGMYRMVTSRRQSSDVFKQMDIDISAEYDQRMGFDPYHYLEEQGMIKANGDTDSIFTDWALFGDEVVERKKNEIKRRIAARRQTEMLFTRADGDDKPKDEDTGEQTIKDKCVSLFSLSMSDVKKLMTLGLYDAIDPRLKSDYDFAICCAYHEKTTLRHIQKVSNGQDYVCDTYKENPYLAYSMKFTYSKYKQTGKQFTAQDLYNEVFHGIKPQLKKLSLPSVAIHIPIPVVTAVEFFIKIEPVVKVNLGITGEVEFTQGLGEIEKIVEYNKGQQTGAYYDVNENKNKDFKFSKFDVCGKFEFDASIGVLAGFGTTGGTFGLGIGASIGANFKFQKTIPSSSDDGSTLEVYFEPYIKAFATSPGGIDWASIKWSIPGMKAKYSLLPKQTFPYYPSLSGAKGSVKVESNGGHPQAELKGSFKVKDLNLMAHSGTEQYKIGAYFYESNPTPEFPNGMSYIGKAIEQQLTTMKGRKYEFSIVYGDYQPEKKYYVVPYIRDVLGDEDKADSYYRYEKNKFELTNKSSMTNVDLYLQSYSDGWNKDPSKDTNTEEWIFIQRVQIANLKEMVNWVGGWGCRIRVERLTKEGEHIDYPVDNKDYPCTEIVYDNNVYLKFKLRVKPRDTYNFKVEVTPYYMSDGEKVFVKNSNLYAMEIDMVRNWEGANEKFWRLNEGMPYGAQVVEMGAL